MGRVARIGHDDILRAAKACRKAGWTGARITLDLENKKIDVFLGDAMPKQTTFEDDGWDDE